MYFSYPQETLKEIPDEITLALSISGCPLRCDGCHSAFTWKPTYGDELTYDKIDQLLNKHKYASCVLFYGGEWLMDELVNYAQYIKDKNLKVALYSGNELSFFPPHILDIFDYIKVGPYVKDLGGIQNPNTNQRFYKITIDGLEDLTSVF